MIIAVGNTKGGVGKTTIAVNLVIFRAVAGRDVLLVDGDEQGSASLFSQLRAALTVADVVLVPVQPRSFDVWALDQVAALVTEACEINTNLRALAFPVPAARTSS